MAKIKFDKMGMNNNSETARRLEVVIETLSDCLKVMRNSDMKDYDGSGKAGEAFKLALDQLSSLRNMQRHFEK